MRSQLDTWILTYVLTRINTNLGLIYLDKIDDDGAKYPEIIQDAIREVIADTSTAGTISNQLGLYLPKSTLGFEGKPITVLNFFFLSLYWLRKFRPERIPMEKLLEKITHTDLYLIGPNLYEHHPGRKILSYYDDQELYLRFGRIGSEIFPKIYESKKEQLDGFINFGLSQHGYVEILSWSRPIRLRYFPPKSRFSHELSLEELLQMKITKLVLPRLSIQIYASWPWLLDREAWNPLISLIDDKANLFYNEYVITKQNDYILTSASTLIHYINHSIMSPPQLCLICNVVRLDEDFALCDHPICIVCQALLKSARCPFCTEHFTSESIQDDFVISIQSNLTANRPLHDKVLKVINAATKRMFKFDWANLDIRLFGLKSM